MFPIVSTGVGVLCDEQAYAVSANRNLDSGEDTRYGTGDYVGVDPGKMFSEEGTSDGSLLTGMINIIDFAVTYVMLPIALLMMMWRTVYLAIFPMMAQMDPLDLLHSGRYQNANKPQMKGSVVNPGNMTAMNQAISGNTRSILDSMSATKSLRDNTPITSLKREYYTGAYFDNPSEDMTGLAKQALKIEMRFLFLGLIIVFITFGLIKLLMQVAIIFIQTASQAAGMV